MKREYMFGILGGALLCAACAGAPKPTDQLVNAQAALRAADEVGADKIPQAQLHAQLAKEQIARANKLIEDGDNAEAERVLLRAKADAELAVALSRKAEASQGLEQAQGAMAMPSGSADSANARNP
jgi:hypothetical protein